MKIDKDYKIRNLTPELSEKIQKICFEQGVLWEISQDNVSYPYMPQLFIYTKPKHITHSSYNDEEFDAHNSEEITPQEFIEKFGKAEKEEGSKWFPKIGEKVWAWDDDEKDKEQLYFVADKYETDRRSFRYLVAKCSGLGSSSMDYYKNIAPYKEPKQRTQKELTRKEIAEKFNVDEDFILVD